MGIENIEKYAFGIDISRYQCSGDGKVKVNFDIIKSHTPKVTFIFARNGIASYYTDTCFQYFWGEMKRIGVCRGAYHVLHFDELAQPQVDRLFAGTTDWDFEHDRIALDCEVAGSATKSKITDITVNAVNIIKARTGRYPIIYSRASWVNPYLDVIALPANTDWWLANYLTARPYPEYTPEMTPPPLLPRGVTKWLIHQTGEKCPGIGSFSRYMDYDRWNGSEEDVLKYFGYGEEEVPQFTLEQKVEILWNAHQNLWDGG